MNAIGGCGNAWGLIQNSWGKAGNSWGVPIQPPPPKEIPGKHIDKLVPEKAGKLLGPEVGGCGQCGHIDLQA